MSKHTKQNIYHLTIAAEQGEAYAQFLLGSMLATGQGVQKDEAQAVEWFTKSAQQGNIQAQFNLACMYKEGLGVAKDEAKAQLLVEKAAKQGDERAQFALGLIYGGGQGVLQNESEAFEWFKKSANQGFAEAQFALGIMYGKGQGVAKDEAQAEIWIKKAADQGQKEAIGMYRKIYAKKIKSSIVPPINEKKGETSSEFIAPSEALLAAIDAFLDAHYEFRRKDKYKGFIGKIRASFDRYEVEEREKQTTGARYYTPQFQRDDVFFSDPHAWEKFEKEAHREEEEFLRLAIEQSFSTALMKLIEAKGKDAVEVYKRANIDRKLFSKIRSNHSYIPSKKTIIALALALELSLDETQTILGRAGFTLSRSILFDVIIEYFISQGKYDIYEINNVLFAYKQPILN